MSNYHNPTGVTSDELQKLPAISNEERTAGEFRLLTVDEIQVLSDQDQDRVFFISVFNALKPECFDPDSHRWWDVILPPSGGFMLHEEVSYRTTAPLGVFAEKLNCFLNASTSATCFVKGFKAVAALHHERMREKGFWDMRDAIVDACAQDVPGRSFEQAVELKQAATDMVDTAALALVTTETSETVEALRHGNGPDDKIPHHCGAAAELADVILRIMDLAHARKWDVAQALVDKMQMNQGREKMHGKNF